MFYGGAITRVDTVKYPKALMLSNRIVMIIYITLLIKQILF